MLDVRRFFVPLVTIGAAASLAISGYAQPPSSTPPSSADLAQAETSLANLERAAASTCPREALHIHELTAKAREFIALGYAVPLQVFQAGLSASVSLCNREKENCGTGPVRIGMTEREAIHTSWCFPDKKNTTETAGHTSAQWVYQSPGDFKRGYLYFDDGRLTAIQETP
jgi:hypothetical protein